MPALRWAVEIATGEVNYALCVKHSPELDCGVPLRAPGEGRGASVTLSRGERLAESSGREANERGDGTR